MQDGSSGVRHDEEIALLVHHLEVVVGAGALALAADDVKRLRSRTGLRLDRLVLQNADVGRQEIRGSG